MAEPGFEPRFSDSSVPILVPHHSITWPLSSTGMIPSIYLTVVVKGLNEAIHMKELYKV